MSFADLGLAEPFLRAVADTGYTVPTPIQKLAIPPVAAGRDVLGIAQTGTGKTAAFTLPLLQRLASAPAPGGGRPIRALVLTPTRELAAQIGDSARTYGKHVRLSHTVIFGGVGQFPQEQALKRGVDLLIATPGRLLDLMNQRIVSLARVEILVLDEADRMLDMGFIHDIRRIVAQVPKQRQTLFFSATMPSAIGELAGSMLREPVRVEVAPVSSAAETVAQAVYHVAKPQKQALLEELLRGAEVTRALVFTRTKHGADKVARKLTQSRIAAEAIHGNKSQNARLRALAAFKNGQVRVLVASDIAARGLDIDEISHVVNFEIPNEPETYVHRIGRTGRAGASGRALSLCDHEERAYLRDIEKLIGKRVPVLEHARFSLAAPASAPAHGARPQQHGGRPPHAPRPQPHGGHPQHAPRPQQHAPRPQPHGAHPQHAPRPQQAQPQQHAPRPAQAPAAGQPPAEPEAQRLAPMQRPIFKRRGPPPPTW